MGGVKAAEKETKRSHPVFASGAMELSQTDTVKMKIDTENKPSIKLKQNKTPLNRRKIMDKAINEMSEAKVLERFQSPWSFPIVVVDRQDGTKRVCVDFRELNKFTKTMSCNLPLTDVILAQLGKTKYFYVQFLNWVTGK